MDILKTQQISSKQDRSQTDLDKHRVHLQFLQQARFCNEELELSLLFDHRWYSITHLNKELSFERALAHFLTEGLKQYWEPSPFFPRSIMRGKPSLRYGH